MLGSFGGLTVWGTSSPVWRVTCKRRKIKDAESKWNPWQPQRFYNTSPLLKGKCFSTASDARLDLTLPVKGNILFYAEKFVRSFVVVVVAFQAQLRSVNLE